MATITQKIDSRLQEKRNIIQKLTLFDDIMFNICMTGSPEAVQQVLRTVLEMPDLIVEDVRTQEMQVSLTDRSVILDVLATDSKGRKFNIELQRSSSGAFPKRTRFIRSRIDSTSLDKGSDIKDLPDLFVVFITEEDYFGKNKPVYHFRMMDTEDHEELDDGTEVVYVNGSWNHDDEIGHLMNDFRQTDPAQMRPGILKDRVQFFKTPEKEGELIMCDLLEEYYAKRDAEQIRIYQRMIEEANQKADEANQKADVANHKADKIAEDCAITLLQFGASMQEVSKKTQLPLERVQKLAQEQEDKH